MKKYFPYIGGLIILVVTSALAGLVSRNCGDTIDAKATLTGTNHASTLFCSITNGTVSYNLVLLIGLPLLLATLAAVVIKHLLLSK